MSEENKSNTSTGIGILAVLAIVLSWTTNHSIMWAIIHGLCGGFYVFYRILGFGGGE